jgi:uncharacterized membrane protein YeaQ/YmgE (transglycosylase-associated protein family)
MGLITWIIFGAIAGWITGLMTGTKDRRGCIGNIILGVIGAFIGGFVVELITGNGFSFAFNVRSFLVAVLGSILLLTITGAIRKKQR